MAHEEPPAPAEPENTARQKPRQEGQPGTTFKAMAASLPSWRVLGALGILVSILGSFIWSHAEDNPEIAALIHSRVFMSDRALALTLQRGRGSDDSPLNEQIFEELQYHLSETEETKKHLRDVAKDHSVRSYSGSRTYMRHIIPLISVRCLMLSDPILRRLVLDVLEEQDEQTVDCSDAQRLQDNAGLPFVDFSPLVLPFIAKADDDVDLAVYIDSHKIENNAIVVSVKEGRDLIELSTYPEAGLSLDSRVQDNYLSAKIEVPEGRSDHYVGISLNDTGRNMVFPTGDSIEGNHASFVISLFATVTITP